MSDTTRKTDSPLRARIAALRKLYGRPERPAVTEPFQQILWENVAYLADDARRAQAFAMLAHKVGLDPKRILAAPTSRLREIGRKGILPGGSAAKLREIAEIAIGEFGGNLRSVAKLPLPAAKKALRRFPSIGEPSAEKVLLFARSHAVFPMDSNVLRVLQRLGYGREGKSYAASYRATREAVAPELPRDFNGLIGAYLLLRRHGQELCTRTHPRCEVCPLRDDCAYAPSGA